MSGYLRVKYATFRRVAEYPDSRLCVADSPPAQGIGLIVFWSILGRVIGDWPSVVPKAVQKSCSLPSTEGPGGRILPGIC